MTAVVMPDERAGIDLAKVWLPGFHYGISFEEYCTLPYLNASTLCWAHSSALHLKTALDGKLSGKSTVDRLFGRALHARLLEPHLYHDQYVVAPGCQAILASGKAKGAPCNKTVRYLVKGEWLCGSHVPKALVASGLIEEHDNLLTVGQSHRIEGAARAVSADKIIRLLRLPNGGYEATGLFEWNGVKCKMRLDKWLPRSEYNPPAIIDLKKTQVGAASKRAVERACFEYLYDIKCAFYCRGVETLTLESPLFYWIYVEDNEPYGINVIQADDATRRAGRMRLDDCWNAYSRGMETGEWPGYMDDSSQPDLGGLPEWAKKKILSFQS